MTRSHWSAVRDWVRDITRVDRNLGLHGVTCHVSRVTCHVCQVCAALAEGGLTPSPGVMAVISTNVTIPCFAMVRPRAGDFVYSELELQAMERDIEVMISCGAVGLVLGCLNTKGM